MKNCAFAAALVLAGSLPAWAAGGSTKPAAHTVTIAIDLDVRGADTKYGKASGFVPWLSKVRVGDSVRFINVDDEAHTATSPDINDLNAHGGKLSQPWSTGTVASQTTSRAFLADKPGVYRYLCRYHLAKGQRAVILVEK